MHIAIDAHMVGERETGNETYTLNLVRALLRGFADPQGFHNTSGVAVAGLLPGPRMAGSGDRPQRTNPGFGTGLRFSLLTTHPERLQAALPNLPPAARIVPMRPGNALLRIPLILPWLAARHRFDLLHVTYNAPPLKPCPTVVTIHDISFEHYPQFFSPRDLLILKTLVPLSARRAARIITVSQHAKREIIERYGIQPEKIAVTYEAAGQQFRPIEDAEALQAVRRKYGIDQGPFVLALGNLQPRKNIRRLVEAFSVVAQAERETRPADSDPWPAPATLVIAGKAQWRESQVYQAVAEAGLEEAVIFPGYIDDADLPALFSAATVFVFPSLYEGFGLPPLEAMACGTPVICSNAASLPEVVGDAALTIDPTDTAALALALADVLANAGLQADLRARGLRRAAQFSWDRCAAETLAVYEEAIEKRQR